MILLPLFAAAAISAAPAGPDLKLVCKGTFRSKEYSEKSGFDGKPVPVVTSSRRSGEVHVDLYGTVGQLAFDNGAQAAFKDAAMSPTAINASYTLGEAETDLAIDRVGGTLALTERGKTVFYGKCKGPNPPAAKGAPQF